MKRLLYLLLFLIGFPVLSQQKPNVILIIADDQGYGDIGYHGNPIIKTPNLDKFARESVRLRNFYVSPVCAPTRASLMTGRYSLRTGMHDTYNGGAIMATEEITIAEMLKAADYKTGIFGKWHLGDNYPYRPSEQGFDESLIHLSGGMGQPGDFTTYYKFDSSYFDPILWHNNEMESYKGYCSDIFADQAINFIRKNKDAPFFCYLAFNAPHTPLQVPLKYYNMYKDVDPTTPFSTNGKPMPDMSEKDKEDARKVYAMVTNIDDNVGRIMLTLDQLKIEKNTIIIFMTDNGPQQFRYTGGFRDRKGSVYQGGVRVPFFLKYPDHFKKSLDIDANTAHIDILPTLASLCDIPVPSGIDLDGKSLLPLMEGKAVDWANRSLFFYWTRKYPEKYFNIAQQKGPWKLVGQVSYDAGIEEFELYHLKDDPYEQNNIVQSNKEQALQLKKEMEANYNDLTRSPYLIKQRRITIGNKNENPIYLNRNDASGQRGIWTQQSIHGEWLVNVEEGIYDIELKFIEPVNGEGTLILETGSLIHKKVYDQGRTDTFIMKDVLLPMMECSLIPMYHPEEEKGGSNDTIFPLWVKLTKK